MVLSRGLRASSASAARPVGARDDAGWLARFHRGDRAILEDCYREQFATVDARVAPLLRGADRETAIHEVFARLMSGEELRQSFQGGSLAAWLATVARNHATDARRRLAREKDALGRPSRRRSAPPRMGRRGGRATADRTASSATTCNRTGSASSGCGFLQQLPQREAAARLSIRRTTLAYRELRIRRLLRRFLLRPAVPSFKEGEP